MLTTQNSFRPEQETDADREAARLAAVEAAYRREHEGYLLQGKSDRAAAVVAAARAELGIDIAGPSKRPTGGKRR